MKKAFLFLILLMSALAWAQLSTTGTIAVASTNCASSTCVVQQLYNSPQVSTTYAAVTVTGTWNATLLVEMSADNGNTWVLQGTIPSNGTYSYPAATWTVIRVRASSYSSGPATVVIQASTANNVISGGSYAGNVSLNGSQTPSANYFAQYATNGSANGGLINWRDVPGNAITVSQNPFGFTGPVQPPTVTVTSSGCGSRPLLTNNQYLSVVWMNFDNPGSEIVSQPTTVFVPSSGSNCYTVTSPVGVVPGQGGSSLGIGYITGACQSASGPCTNYTYQSSLNAATNTLTVAGVERASGTTLTYGYTTTGSLVSAIPINTAGLEVPGVKINFGSNLFVLNVPPVIPSFSSINFDDGLSTQFQLSQSSPNGIMTPGEPYGVPVTGSSGTAGQSVTAAFGYYDSCPGTPTLVQGGPPRTFPAFVTYNGNTYNGIKINNPGVPFRYTPWVASTLYWGSNASFCAGERVNVITSSNTAYLILGAQAVGASSATQPNWATVCTNLTPGSGTCPDGTQTWGVIADIKTWRAGSYTLGGNTLASPGMVFAIVNSVPYIWEVQGTCTASGSVPANFATYTGLGDTASDSGCNWINLGTYVDFASPLFQIFTAACAPNLSTEWGKQCSGGGSTGSAFLTQLTAQSATGSAAWSGGDSAITVNGSSLGATLDGQGQATQTTTVYQAGGSTAYPVSPAISDLGSCPAIGAPANCNFASGNPVYLQIAPVTPMGPAPGYAESALGSFTSGHALTTTCPTTLPANAIGCLGFVSNDSSSTGSANDWLQQPDGIQALCSVYVTSLPYGRVCAPGSTMTFITYQTSTLHLPPHGMSEYMVAKGSPPLLPYWNGGCYDAQILNAKFEAGKILNQGEPFAWGVVNTSCQEHTTNDTFTANDTMAGAEYNWDVGSQNIEDGYIKHLGQYGDYTVTALYENVGVFHGLRSISSSPTLGTQWLGYTSAEVITDLTSQGATVSGNNEGGDFRGIMAEGMKQRLLVINTGIMASNQFGRCCATAGRSSYWGVHLDQYTPTVDLSTIWNTNLGYQVQDDVCDPGITGLMGTMKLAPLARYTRGSNSSGQPACGGSGNVILTSDPTAGMGHGFQVVQSYCFGLLGSSVTVYTQGFSTTCNVTTPNAPTLGFSGTVVGFQVTFGGVAASASGIVVTLQKNGVNTGLTCTVATSASSCTATGTLATYVTYTAANNYNIQMVTGAGESTGSTAKVNIFFQ